MHSLPYGKLSAPSGGMLLQVCGMCIGCGFVRCRQCGGIGRRSCTSCGGRGQHVRHEDGRRHHERCHFCRKFH